MVSGGDLAVEFSNLMFPSTYLDLHEPHGREVGVIFILFQKLEQMANTKTVCDLRGYILYIQRLYVLYMYIIAPQLDVTFHLPHEFRRDWNMVIIYNI